MWITFLKEALNRDFGGEGGEKILGRFSPLFGDRAILGLSA